MDRIKHICALMVIWICFDGTYSQLTIDEVHGIVVAFHDNCHKKFPIDEALLDEVNLGRYPDNHDLKCYINCMFEQMRFVRKGKYNAELIAKYITIYAPVQFQQEWLRGIEACKDLNYESNDACERSYVLAQCFAKNNDHFMVP